MDILNLFSLVILVTSIFSFLNCRFLKLPSSIGLMLGSILFSVLLIVLGELGLLGDYLDWGRDIIRKVKFDEIVLHGMLCLLLFAGALHVNFEDILKNKYTIGLLATVGVVFSSFFVAYSMQFILSLLGFNVAFLHCLIFGALISPTDPIAVLSILKSLGAPKAVSAKITGESLFNDGVSVVLFTVILTSIEEARDPDVLETLHFFVKEFFGGILLGVCCGYIAYLLLIQIKDYVTEVLITLALVLGVSSVSEILHVSAPLAAVSSGLLLGNHGRHLSMSNSSTNNIDFFWHLVDEILNSILFVLLGLEVLVLSFNTSYLGASLLAIPVVLLARFLGVFGVISSLKFYRKYGKNTIKILTWGGLRGGISAALALALPNDFINRELIITMTFSVVVFSVLVQGMTIKHVVNQQAK